MAVLRAMTEQIGRIAPTGAIETTTETTAEMAAATTTGAIDLIRATGTRVVCESVTQALQHSFFHHLRWV